MHQDNEQPSFVCIVSEAILELETHKWMIRSFEEREC